MEIKIPRHSETPFIEIGKEKIGLIHYSLQDQIFDYLIGIGGKPGNWFRVSLEKGTQKEVAEITRMIIKFYEAMIDKYQRSY